MNPVDKDQNTEKNPPSMGFISLLKSAFGALFGIQSNQQREKDFKYGKPADFIVIGIVMVIGLLIGMIWLVNSIIPS